VRCLILRAQGASTRVGVDGTVVGAHHPSILPSLACPSTGGLHQQQQQKQDTAHKLTRPCSTDEDASGGLRAAPLPPLRLNSARTAGGLRGAWDMSVRVPMQACKCEDTAAGSSTCPLMQAQQVPHQLCRQWAPRCGVPGQSPQQPAASLKRAASARAAAPLLGCCCCCWFWCCWCLQWRPHLGPCFQRFE